MSTEELCRTAQRPYRIQDRIMRKRGLDLATEMAYLAYNSPHDPSITYPAWRLDPVLLPGGRWIIDIATDPPNSMLVLCWDAKSFGVEGYNPVAAISLRLDTIWLWSQQASEDSMKVNVLLNGFDDHQDWSARNSSDLNWR
ncbi:hypothetical protein DL93DRAFT_2082109 [Clavulina sp. PMI_390]|nr:hypothetical protein DL93DRAFT_2082109 [Clavulina sp. PMI_390]